MQKIILDVVPNGIEPRVYVNQFDTGRTFQIAFKENFGSYYFPNDVVFRINGRKADNHIFEYSEADKWDATHYVITKSGSGDALVVTIATTEQMTAAAGEAEVQLTFKSSSASNDILGTLNFILVVQEKPDANGDPSESDIPGLVRSVNGIDPDASGNVLLPPAQGAIGAHNIAPVEPTRIMSTARAAGTQVYVTADDQLYNITSPIGSGGTLTPGTNATVASISSDLASIPMLTTLWASPNVAEGIVDNIALSESVFNFYFLMLCAKTNADYTYQLVPTASIDVVGKDHSILIYMAGGAWNATTSQYAYTGIAGFVFKNGTDGTKFTSTSQCNNANWRPKPYYIAGFMRK